MIHDQQNRLEKVSLIANIVRYISVRIHNIKDMPKEQDSNTALAPERAKTKPPGMFRVLLFNDDYTTMEFVIEVLRRFFLSTVNALNNSCSKYTTRGRRSAGYIPAMWLKPRSLR